MQHKVEIDFHGRPLSIEVGRMAKQASGSALVQYGETVVLTTAVASQSTRPGIDFFPLTVDYQEKAFAAGKIPGGFFKREGRQGEKEILTSRLIDRPIRPLFADGYKCETQIIATVLSFDKESDSDTIAMLGASTALHVSDIPFLSPIAGVRIGRIGGKFVINPYLSQMAESDLNLLVAGTKDSIVMVEGGAKMLSEDVMLDALYTALDALQPLLKMQEELRAKLGKPKREVVVSEIDKNIQKAVEALALPRIEKAMTFVAKLERHAAISAAHKETQAAALEQFPDQEAVIREVIEEVESRAMRQMIVKQKKRLDGRGVDRRAADQLRGGGAAAHARVVALHPRRDAGAGRRRRSARRPTSSASTRWSASTTASSCCTTTSRRSASARPSRCAARAGARSATARSPSARSTPSCRTRRRSPTRSASCRRSSSRTARRRWRRSAPAASR